MLGPNDGDDMRVIILSNYPLEISEEYMHTESRPDVPLSHNIALMEGGKRPLRPEECERYCMCTMGRSIQAKYLDN